MNGDLLRIDSERGERVLTAAQVDMAEWGTLKDFEAALNALARDRPELNLRWRYDMIEGNWVFRWGPR